MLEAESFTLLEIEYNAGGSWYRRFLDGHIGIAFEPGVAPSMENTSIHCNSITDYQFRLCLEHAGWSLSNEDVPVLNGYYLVKAVAVSNDLSIWAFPNSGDTDNGGFILPDTTLRFSVPDFSTPDDTVIINVPSTLPQGTIVAIVINYDIITAGIVPAVVDGSSVTLYAPLTSQFPSGFPIGMDFPIHLTWRFMTSSGEVLQTNFKCNVNGVDVDNPNSYDYIVHVNENDIFTIVLTFTER